MHSVIVGFRYPTNLSIYRWPSNRPWSVVALLFVSLVSALYRNFPYLNRIVFDCGKGLGSFMFHCNFWGWQLPGHFRLILAPLPSDCPQDVQNSIQKLSPSNKKCQNLQEQDPKLLGNSWDQQLSVCALASTDQIGSVKKNLCESKPLQFKRDANR